MLQIAPDVHRNIERDAVLRERFIKGAQQREGLRRLALEIREHTGRVYALRLKGEVESETLGTAQPQSARRIAQAEKAAALHRRELSALERSVFAQPEAQMKHLHSLRGGAHGVPSGAHSYQIFGIYHEKRLLYIIVTSLWTFTVNSFTLYAGSRIFMSLPGRSHPDFFIGRPNVSCKNPERSFSVRSERVYE